MRHLEGRLLTLALVLAVVWIPELNHWHVRPAPLAPTSVQQARTLPADDLLREIASMQLRGLVVPHAQLQAAAEAITRGELPLPGFPTQPIGLPFRAGDLEQGSPTWGLMFASLASADILLDAHAATGREDWWILARDIIVAFARHERSRWLDQGLMWNDHATSARIPVLVKFWHLYRKRIDRDPETERDVLQLVSRSALLLARADAYAWRTSHGVLSDLALLQIAAAFPALAEAGLARQIAFERLQLHLKYWINAEGMTLLHSAGYHSGSLYHFSLALRLITLCGLQVPAGWWDRFELALDLESRLRRPDGTLPLLGDTLNLSDTPSILVTARGPAGQALPLRPFIARPIPPSAMVLPGAGYALWHDGSITQEGLPGGSSQTVITWAYHEGLGHKMADELSLLIWSRGRNWVTNTGYWPYGVWGRAEAESWAASNAPHLVGEPADSGRVARPLVSGEADDVRFVEVERRGPGDFHVSRQVLRIPSMDAWLVLDHRSDQGHSASEVAWTFDAALKINAAGNGLTFEARQDNDAAALQVAFFSSSGTAPTAYRGSRSPFYGWMVVEREPRPASALVQSLPAAGGWAGAAFRLTGPGQPTSGIRMRHWHGPNAWSLEWSTERGEIEVSRTDRRVMVRTATLQEVPLTPVDDGAALREESRAAMALAASSFPKFRELVAYRERVSRWLLALFGLQLVADLVLLTTRRRANTWLLRISYGLWFALAGWLGVYYFT